MDERGRVRERDSPKRIKWGYGPLEGNKLDAPLPLSRTDRVSPNSTIEAREQGREVPPLRSGLVHLLCMAGYLWMVGW